MSSFMLILVTCIPKFSFFFTINTYYLSNPNILLFFLLLLKRSQKGLFLFQPQCQIHLNEICLLLHPEKAEEASEAPRSPGSPQKPLRDCEGSKHKGYKPKKNPEYLQRKNKKPSLSWKRKEKKNQNLWVFVRTHRGKEEASQQPTARCSPGGR